MFRPEYLKAKMAENKINADVLSDILGIDSSTFHRKMRGDSEFTRAEMQGIKHALYLSSDDMDAIFFNQELAEMQVIC